MHRSDHTITCSRSDALAPGQSFPPITLTAQRSAQRSAIGHKHGQRVRRLRCQPGEQHCGRCHGNRSRPEWDDDQEPHGQLHPGANRSSLYPDGQQYWWLPIQWPGDFDRHRSCGVDADVRARTARAGRARWGAQTVICMRSDALNPGASYPPATIMVDVALNAPAMLINTAQVGRRRVMSIPVATRSRIRRPGPIRAHRI